MQEDFSKPLTFPSSARLQRKLNTDTSNPYQLDPWQTNENKPNVWDNNAGGASHLVNDINLYVGPAQQPSTEDYSQFGLNKSSSNNTELGLSGFDSLYSAPTVTDLEDAAVQSRISYHMKMDKVDSNDSNSHRESKTEYHPAQPKEFDWTSYLPEQTLPFQPSQLDKLLELIIVKAPINYQYDQLFFPANSLFLMARHCQNTLNDDLYKNMIHTALQLIETQIQQNSKNLMLLSFWLTNCNQLLYYLKKDSQLSIITIDQQLQLPELIYQVYCIIIQQTQPKLNNVLIPCMLEHDIIPGLTDIEFKDFKKSNHGRKKSHGRPMSPRQMAQSPRTVTTVLASELFVFEQFLVHPSIIQRYFNQLFYYISNSLFNYILADQNYLSRGKALQIRMNVSYIEEWGRNNIDNILTPSHPQSMGSGTSQHFKPLIQLLEFLQCFTQLKSIHSFLETVNSLSLLSASQVYHCVANYKYELNEPVISQDILRVIRYRYENFPNHSIPTNSDQLMVNSPQLKTLSTTPDPFDTLQSSLRNVHHSLPFGAPNINEMEDWWFDYSPFISEDTLKSLFN